MIWKTAWSGRSAIAAVGAATLVACTSNDITNLIFVNNAFNRAGLVANVAGLGASILDANLVNPWGAAFDPAGNLWVANNGTGTATMYTAAGTVLPTVVAIPSPTASTGGKPTGLVYNGTSDFAISGGPALVIFVGEDGVISAWNSTMTNAQLVVDRSSSGAVYKAVTMASLGGANLLFAADFKNNRVDVFNGSFSLVSSFTDPTVPAGFAPFGIQNIGGQIFVAFALQLPPDNEDDQAGAGNGFIDVFNADGTFARRFASNGTLNSPWAMVVAPAGFGPFAGDILIGNFGNGLIGAYDPTSGAFVDFLRDTTGAAITVDGLWSLVFGPSGSTTLYFASGPNGETNGLLGTIRPR